MTTPILDPVRAAAVERELASIGTADSRLQRRQRRVRGVSITLGSLALAGTLTGGAIVISTLPGATTVTPLGETVTGSFIGTAELELGTPPEDAAVVILDITCADDGGVMDVPTTGTGDPGVSWDCSDPIFDGSIRIRDARLPVSGSTSLMITAAPGTQWSVAARYAASSTTPWGVNAHGQTYGVPNADGVPDLTAAQATNGQPGYILDAELTAFDGEGFIPVYASDGTTVIGHFPIGDVQE